MRSVSLSLPILLAFLLLALICIVPSVSGQANANLSPTEAARQKSVADAALAAAQTRKPEPIVECRYSVTPLFQLGSCVRHPIECPGSVGNPNKIDQGQRATGKNCFDLGFGPTAACCARNARLPGAEEAERKATTQAELMKKIQGIKTTSPASAPATAGSKPVAAPGNAVSAPLPDAKTVASQGQMACVFTRGTQTLTGYCSPANYLCPTETSYGDHGTTNNFAGTCGKTGGQSSVCCASAVESSQPTNGSSSACPLPSYTAFVEESVEMKPTSRLAHRLLGAKATPFGAKKKSVKKSTKSQSKLSAICIGERRNWLAAQARRGDGKAIATLKLESKSSVKVKNGDASLTKPKSLGKKAPTRIVKRSKKAPAKAKLKTG